MLCGLHRATDRPAGRRRFCPFPPQRHRPVCQSQEAAFLAILSAQARVFRKPSWPSAGSVRTAIPLRSICRCVPGTPLGAIESSRGLRPSRALRGFFDSLKRFPEGNRFRGGRQCRPPILCRNAAWNARRAVRAGPGCGLRGRGAARPSPPLGRQCRPRETAKRGAFRIEGSSLWSCLDQISGVRIRNCTLPVISADLPA